MPPGRRRRSTIASSNIQKRHYCFTANNPTLTPQQFGDELEQLPFFRYVIFQLERGESGTLHFQGYIEFLQSVRGTCFARISTSIRWAVRAGTRMQARTYCQKEDTRISGPYERGHFTGGGRGSRTDLATMASYIQDGSNNLEAIARKYPLVFLKYPRGTMLLRQHAIGYRDKPPSLFLLYGTTGVGKSGICFHRYSIRDGELFRKQPGSLWFDGYDGQVVLLLDDFAGAASQFPLSYLLQLLDRYHVSIEVKGSYTTLKATTIIITTNIHPFLWYNWDKRLPQYAALARRIGRVYYSTDPTKIPKFVEYPFDDFFELPNGPHCAETFMETHPSGSLNLPYVHPDFTDYSTPDDPDLFKVEEPMSLSDLTDTMEVSLGVRGTGFDTPPPFLSSTSESLI